MSQVLESNGELAQSIVELKSNVFGLEEVKRPLLNRTIRTIGAWGLGLGAWGLGLGFAHQYGPTERESAMSIAAHSHSCLQTVSWLISGVIRHRDSLGTIQIVSAEG